MEEGWMDGWKCCFYAAPLFVTDAQHFKIKEFLSL
jgi:hypothetical protein